MVCPLCGYTSNPSGARFCAGCGRLLGDGADAGVDSAQRVPLGATGADRVPTTGPVSAEPAEPSPRERASARGGEAQRAEPASAHHPGDATPPSNGRRAANGAPGGQRRPEADARPSGEPRREAPRWGDPRRHERRSDPPPAEAFGLPAGVTALASSSRAWAVAAPVSALVAGFMSGIPALFGLLGADVGARVGLGGLPAILGPLLVWQLRQKDDPFSAQHGLNALNFNLTVLTLAFGLSLFTTLTWGIGALFAVPAGIALVVGWLVCSAIATSRAAKGESYRYPLTFRFARNP